MRALIIDDSEAIRSLLRRLLENLGLEVVEASDGQDALHKMENPGSIDVAFVDWKMPKVNGYDFIKTVRAKQAYKGTIMIMISSEMDLPQIKVALDAGANEYIMKPFTLEVILEKLRILGITPPK